jgi:hypothetical protein
MGLYGLCFAEYTFVPYKYFLANFVIIINPAIAFAVSVKIMLEPSKTGTYKMYLYQEWLHGYRVQVT